MLEEERGEEYREEAEKATEASELIDLDNNEFDNNKLFDNNRLL